jgi:hypothetical protein
MFIDAYNLEEYLSTICNSQENIMHSTKGETPDA